MATNARTVANLYQVNVSHLKCYELIYELFLRKLSTSGTTQELERRLRYALREEPEYTQDYICRREPEKEFTFIQSRLVEIEDLILLNHDGTVKSRLYHYYKRLRRLNIQNSADDETRHILVDVIEEMLRTYFNEDIDAIDQIYERSPSDENEGNVEEVNVGAGTSSGGTGSATPGQGAIPKIVDPNRRVSFRISHNSTPVESLLYPENQGSSSGRNLLLDETEEEVRSRGFIHLSEIDDYVQRCVSQAMGNQSQPTSGGRVDYLTGQMSNLNVRESGAGDNAANFFQNRSENPFSTTNRQLGQRTFSIIPGHLQVPSSISGHPPLLSNLNPQISGPSGSSTPCNPGHSFDFPQRRNNSPRENVRQPTRRQPHQLCKIIGSWEKFSGDNSPIPLAAFLRNIDMMCESYEITKEELRRHAHILFKGDAYTWYTTYVKRFTTWETLLYYLNLRYDNPNRDQYIRDEMNARKQKPNELFSAYLTDMESMAQDLMIPMTEYELFSMVAKNTKISYKRRLALEDIQSLDHLAQKCYRFDALEQNLYKDNSRATYSGTNCLGTEDYDDYEGEEANVLALRSNNRPQKAISSAKPSNELVESICWNCRKREQHSWRNCPDEKRIFCHVCGFQGKIASKCPNNHHPAEVQALEPKNESEEED